MKDKNWKYILIILLGAIIIMLPKIINGYQINDDTEFHVANITATLETMDDWLPDDILPNIFGNFGYATRQFYPILAHTVVAYTAKITSLNVLNCLKLVHTLVLFLSGLTMYFLALRLSKNKKLSLVSAFIYMLFPYHLSEIYVRDALAECFIYIFLPMIIEGLTYLFEDKRKFLLLFCLGYIGGMLSHLTLMIYFTILLIPFFIINFKKIFNKNNLHILSVLCVAALIILGITSPVIFNLLQNSSSGYYRVFVPGVMAQGIEHSGLWLDYLNYFGIFNNILFNGSTIKFYIDIVVLIMLILVFIKRKSIDFKNYHFILIFGLISFIMSLIIFPWDFLPTSFRMLQFPWRLETFVALSVAIIAPLVLKKIKINEYIIIIVMLTLGLIFNTATPHQDIMDLNNINYERGMGWVQEYLPIKTYDNWQNIKNDYAIKVNYGKASIISDNYHQLIFDVSDDTEIVLPRLYYFGYVLRDSNNNTYLLNENDQGLISAKVLKGTYTLTYEKTSLVQFGEKISLITIFLFIIYLFIKKDKRLVLEHKIDDLFIKYKQIVLYIIFGVLTTVINILTFYILDKLKVNLYLNNSIAWIVSVIFAFITNKIFVFESKDKTFKVVLKEGISFTLARILSYFVDMLTIFVLFQIVGMNKIVAKIISNIIVIIINYVLSKLFIFKKD